MKMTVMTLLALFTTATLAMAADQPSVDHGKVLFNSTALGTNGKSCATCHPNGKGLEDAAAYDAKKMDKIVNQCIVKALKGKALASDSTDLASLVSYMKTLGSH